MKEGSEESGPASLNHARISQGQRPQIQEERLSRAAHRKGAGTQRTSFPVRCDTPKFHLLFQNFWPTQVISDSQKSPGGKHVPLKNS